MFFLLLLLSDIFELLIELRTCPVWSLSFPYLHSLSYAYFLETSDCSNFEQHISYMSLWFLHVLSSWHLWAPFYFFSFLFWSCVEDLFSITVNSMLIHTSCYCSYVPTPVLVIIDVQPKELGIPTKAYYAVEEVKEVSRRYYCLTPYLCILYNFLLLISSSSCSRAHNRLWIRNAFIKHKP